MKKICQVLLAMFAHQFLFATAQESDLIIYNTQYHMLFTNPLESYEWPDGKPSLYGSEGGTSTANGRGYIAVWEIREGKLFLIAIRTFVESGWVKTEDGRITNEHDSIKGEDVVWVGPSYTLKYRQIGLEELLPEKISKGRIFADWFSGTLRIPIGDELKYVHMGYQSVSEKDVLIHVNKGIIEGTVIIDNTDTHKDQPVAGGDATR